MRIAIWHNLPSGGGKRALYDHVRYLVRAGHHVEAWCPSSADRTFLPLSQIIPEHELPIEPRPLDGARARLYRFAQANARVVERLEAMEAHCREAGAQIQAGKFDVLLGSSCGWFHAPAIGRHVTGPRVLYLQEPSRDLYEATYQARKNLRWLAESPLPNGTSALKQLRAWVGSALRIEPYRLQAREELAKVASFDKVLVNSLFSRESVLRAYGIAADVCYLGIDTERFSVNTGPREDFALMVGVFGGHKNPEFLIRALGASATRPPLVWVANYVDGAELAAAQQLAATLGLQVDVRSGIAEAELASLYQRARVLVYAPRLEPFGLAPLEASACGTPVIGAAEGGVKETVIDGVTGFLVEPKPEAMARAIDTLFADPALGHKLGARGAEIVRERWTLDAAGRRLEAALRETIAAHTSRRDAPSASV